MYAIKLGHHPHRHGSRLAQTLVSYSSSQANLVNKQADNVAVTTTERRSRFQSVYDDSTDWRDWFSATEYENPWDRSSGTRLAHSLDFGPADAATRHLIQVLQNFHRYENVTSAQCNVTLQNLLELSKGEPSIAERAKAILENMEFLDDNNPLSDESDRIARALPKPNRTTYNTVLRIYGKTKGSVQVPEQARSIVERMEQRHEARQELEMKPNAFHWNCVLLAYKECDDPKRAIHALQVLTDKRHEMDASSYIHMLQICAFQRKNEEPERLLLGANVAIRLFQEMFEKDAMPISRSLISSHFYAFFLQAIRPLEKGSRLRDQYFNDCFAIACREGKINRFILKDFILHVQSASVFDRFLGPYRKDIYGLKADEAVKTLLRIVPDSWIENAN